MPSERYKRMKADQYAHGFRSSFRDWAAEGPWCHGDTIELALAHSPCRWRRHIAGANDRASDCIWATIGLALNSMSFCRCKDFLTLLLKDLLKRVRLMSRINPERRKCNA